MVQVTRDGAFAVTLSVGRKYAILEHDREGDTILTLTDRESDGDAHTGIVTGSLDEIPEQVRQFFAADKSE
jgi:hypothetical protein